ncbi:hypothetical protein AUC61_03370 [Pseudomonas sp. S25]|uniref:Acetoacetate decarboxylase (ADC) n=1 Tax=Pseudomonas maioricensis TaxID=1766623 RepID=A0ABS9ZEF3_9PSED|nr:hypothetical protein [Pseudomonas sp. S25]MCI8208567.1 hypothetical protein [Pseudomonas sp. S25]
MTHTIGKPGSQKLFPPYVPQAHRHGVGIRAAAHLLVNIDPYPNMEAGDLIELFWGGSYVASKVLDRSDVGYTMVLRVPESFLQSGTIKTYYRLMKIGGIPINSPCRRLRVKLDMPGGLLINDSCEENQGLAPVSLPDTVIRNGLFTSDVKKGLPLSIEPYLNMAPWDEITLRWGDLRMDLEPLDADNVGKPIKLLVPATLIREAGDEPKLEVTYCVIDRVGNNSRWAPPREISVSTLDNHMG